MNTSTVALQDYSNCQETGRSFFLFDEKSSFKLRLRDATYLGEIPDQMAASVVPLCQNIEEERFDVVVKRLVVKEELCQKAQILAVDLTLVAIDFKDRKVV